MFDRQNLIKRSSQLLSALFSIGIAHSAVSLDLAQSPLFLSNDADPNLMFILDDSGSMQFEITPEDYRKDAAFVFPNANNVYGSQKLPRNGHGVATVDDEDAFNALTRSPQINKTYYNPSVTYTPWVRYDGSSYPDADPSCAWHNPENTGDLNSCPDDDESVSALARNLTVDNGNYGNYGDDWGEGHENWQSCSSNGTCAEDWSEKTFWPASYFWHKGGGLSEWDWDSYETKVEIRSTTATYSGHGRESRSDCVDGTCTYAQEIQNFANWYTYYRSRVLAARAGIGTAFAEQGETMRVGFGALNNGWNSIDGVNNTGTIKRGVRTFSGTNRQNFFNDLYSHPVNSSGTPLRRALDHAGKYFSRTDNRGPWGADPGADDDTDQLSCRASYTILMTDGYWNGDNADTEAATENVDGAAGPEITRPDGDSYTYSVASPFSDSNNDTLADVAMYYWNRDLHGTLANQVPVKAGSINPAFWQHMVTYGVGFGVQGSVDKDAAFNAIETGAPITWPSPGSSNSAKVDDLLHASVNGRGGFFSAADPQSFATELSGVLADISARSDGSASSVATSSTRLGTDTVIYQALFDSSDWSGELKALNLNADGTIGDVKWEADNNKFSAAATRKVFTHNGTSGAVFAWDSTEAVPGISSAQQDILDGGDDDEVQGRSLVNWVRGAEVAGLRNREKKLGDIVNSSPVFAGRKKYNYHLLSADLGGARYEAYVTTTKSTRTEVVYVGANDGMLHAFNANNGGEIFSYIPSGVYEALVAMSSPSYGTGDISHRYSVDGPLFVGDAYIGNAATGSWKNILVGTLGAGGKGIFALDVTDPTSFNQGDVLFELTEDDIPELGSITGAPAIVPTRDGWKVIVGNGYGSTDEHASLIIIDLEDPTTETVVLETYGGDSNGLAGPSLLPNGRGEIIAAYAGDLLGNMWKFDLTSEDTADWGAAFTGNDGDGNTVNAPLFTAAYEVEDGEGEATTVRQPITATPTLGINEQKDNAVMVYFGTGSYLAETDKQAGDTVNSFYAIADEGAAVTGRSVLMEKSISEQVNGVRTVSNNSDQSWWNDDKSGWFLDLIYNGQQTGERIISKPLLIYDRLLFPTMITSSDPCSFGGSGWQMELVAVGDRYGGHSIFGEDGTQVDYAIISYSQVIEAGGKTYLPTSNIKGEFKNEEGFLPAGAKGRISWRTF